jgi:pimeloyl-ACP methyl ester carboxylesterase
MITRDLPMITRGFASTPSGQIHYAEAGRGRPVILLHQTPRSWDEYRDVLPLLGRRYRAIAMDTVGFGDSYRLAPPHSIAAYAHGVTELMDALGIARASLVGHHTGGVIAVEVAAGSPHRVDRLVLSSTPWVGPEQREARKSRPPIDQVHPEEDGAHLLELWRRRSAFYPEGRPDLLTRFVIDALRVLDHVEEGHRAVGDYQMEERLPLVQAPTLVVSGTDDPFAFPHMQTLVDRLPGCRTAVIPGGMVPLPDQCPQEFAGVILNFLAEFD